MTQLTNVTLGESFIAHVEGQPCSTNRMYGRGASASSHHRRGAVYLTDAAAAWELAVAIQVRAQLDTAALRALWREAGEPDVGVRLTFARVRGDVDNYVKATLDGLKEALGIDDRRFSPVVTQRGMLNVARPTTGACIEITIPTPPESEAPGSLRVADLISPESHAHLAQLAQAGQRPRRPASAASVRVYPADGYDALVLMFPPSPLNPERDSEWGTFLALSQARELRDALNALPELRSSTERGAPWSQH